MSQCDSAIHHRRPMRLKGYDYTQQGMYFITVCAHNKECLFGEIIDDDMRLNDAGRMIQTVWNEIPQYYSNIEIDAFIIMPNHIHGIIAIVGATPRGRPSFSNRQPQGQAQGPAPTLSLPDIVHRFKTLTTKRYMDGVKQSQWPRFENKLWQRNYYEHVIRNDADYTRIAEYITANPQRWEKDTLNPKAVEASISGNNP